MPSPKKLTVRRELLKQLRSNDLEKVRGGGSFGTGLVTSGCRLTM